jgi:hypothetical protein
MRAWSQAQLLPVVGDGDAEFGLVAIVISVDRVARLCAQLGQTVRAVGQRHQRHVPRGDLR